MLIFSLDPECRIARALADDLEVSLAPHEDRAFEDGEHKLRPLVDPRGDDVYVVCGLHGGPADSPHDKLCKSLMLISALRDHGAERVTAVVPYLAYARKDRQTKAFDPLGQRIVAQLFEAVGTAQVIALEVHNPAAFQNAFRIPTIHLPAMQAFDGWAEALAAEGPLAVASPDPGGVKRAQLWQESLAELPSRYDDTM
jgi:ribose-phosphate pyrophosphokinase